VDFELSDEHRLLQSTVRDFARGEVAPVAEELDRTKAFPYDIVRRLGELNLMGIPFPEEYGGGGGDTLAYAIAVEELTRIDSSVAITLCAHTSLGTQPIHLFGSEEQKKKFLPGILTGDVHFAIGYTEPEAGTDLASLRTTAVRHGDEYIVNGQKVFTTGGHDADYIWLACRTDPEAVKHKGISILIVDTKDPGYSWTPMILSDGAHHTNATYYSDVRVPADMLVGEENGGWKLVTNQLNHERVALVSAQPIFLALNGVREWAQNTKDVHGNRLIDSEWVQLNLARVHAKAEVLKLINWELASTEDAAPSPADASAAKVYGTELATEAYRLLMEVLGTAGTLRSNSPGALLRGRVERMHRSCLILTFGGGTNEIQRDIIGMVALGLPRVNR